ncbi:hypothetical protein ACVWYH_005541 [Bradyrhizobium sp. GM24.11]
MSTKSREVIWGGRIMGARIRARVPDNGLRRLRAKRTGPRLKLGPSGWKVTACLNGGLAWLEVECARCKTRASLPLDAIRRPKDTPLWKLEASLKCRSCRTTRYTSPARMIKLTETRQITPYKWVHPSEER